MNLFINVPVPAGNGSGPPVSLAALGVSKTISVAGPFRAAVTIEISNELVPTKWAPLITFNVPDGIVLEFAARWVRATVAGYKSGAPACDIGGSDDGTLFASLPVTVGNGIGPAVDVSALPLAKTITVGGPFGGNVQIEVSEDGVTDWSQLGFGFGNPGQQSQKMTARFMRVVRAGVPMIAPGLPIVDVAACDSGGGGGGGVPVKLYTAYVGKNGVDATADGSIAKPFLTVQAAMDFAYTTWVLPAEPQPASPFIRPCVFVNAGTYDDGPLVLPPQICVMGEGFNHTRIVGDWAIDARWSNLLAMSDFRSTWLNVGIVGSVTVDFLAFDSTEGKLYAMGTRFFSPILITQANNQINTFECKACDFFGNITINGCETTLSACTTYGTTITLNQSLVAGADNKFKSSGGSLGNIVVNSTSAGAPPYNCTFSHLAQPGATLTLNGTFSTIFAVLGAVPLQALVVLAGGANLNQVFRINQLNWFGATADRPPGPYVGQQYFDTTITRPIWWDGANWISWSVIVWDEGVPIAGNPFTTLNFTGTGVTATDFGGGVAKIDIVGVPGPVGPVGPAGPSGNSAILFWGADDVGAAPTIGRYASPGYETGLAVLSDIYQLPMPRAGTLKNLFVRHNKAGGGGAFVTYTILIDGVATLLSTLVPSGLVVQTSDAVNVVAVAAGQRVSLRITHPAIGGPGGGNVDMTASVEFV